MPIKENPLISVILPCYNAMPYLPYSIESILNQTYSNLEIICINDGSTDNTGEVLDNYAMKDSRIQVIHNSSNLKLIATLNKVIDLARGDYIARMDADDVSMPNRIQQQISYLENNPEIDMVSSKYCLIDSKGDIVSDSFLRNHSWKANYFASLLFTPISHAILLSRKSVFKENKYALDVNSLHVEDYELWCRLIQLKGVKIENLNEVLYKIRINENSVSWKFATLQLENFVKINNKYFNLFSKNKANINESKVIANRIDKEVTVNHFRRGIFLIKLLKNQFINEVGLKNRKELNEINLIYKTHLLDISIQTFRRGDVKTKFIASFYLIYLLVMNIINQDSRSYLFSKFSFKRKKRNY